MPSLTLANPRGTTQTANQLAEYEHWIRRGYTPQDGSSVAAGRQLFTGQPETPAPLEGGGQLAPVTAGSVHGLGALLLAGQSAAIQVLGDSTGNETDEWVYRLAGWLGGLYPSHAVRYRLWNDTTQLYDAPTNLQIGPGGTRYVQLTGAGGAYLALPDAAGRNPTGDLDIRVHVAMDDWTPAAVTALASKYGSAGQRSWRLYVGTSGRLVLEFSADGTALLTATSTTAPTVTDGAALWVRVTLDIDNGAAGWTATFYTSTDGLAWTQLGNAITTAGALAALFSTTYQCQLGSRSGNLDLLAGKLYRVEVRNGINGPTVWPVLPELYQQNGGAATVGGSPVLDVVNGSKPGAGLAYLNDPARLPIMTPLFGQSLTFLSTSHNEGNLAASEVIATWDAWLTTLRTRLPGSGFLVIGQNPRTAPAANNDAHARRVALMMAWARRSGCGIVDVFRAFTLDGRPLSSLVDPADGVHPLGPAGRTLMFETVRDAVSAGLAA